MTTDALVSSYNFTEYLINAHSIICHIYTVIKNTRPLLHSHVTATNLAKYK